jgi:hypothetical protein
MPIPQLLERLTEDWAYGGVHGQLVVSSDEPNTTEGLR